MKEFKGSKAELLMGLKMQAAVMNGNAELMQKLMPKAEHHKQLAGAEKITRQWIEAIEKEIDEENSNA